MLNSMTAYGRGCVSRSFGKVVAELSSVNRKFLEIQLFLPKELSRFEHEMRKKISEKVMRGQVTLRLFASFEELATVRVHPNLSLAKQLKAAYAKMAEELSLPSRLDLNLLTREKGILLYEEASEDDAQIQEALFEALETALTALLSMKKEEGDHLTKDFLFRLEKIAQFLETIKALAGSAKERIFAKLNERVKEMLGDLPDNEERIYREVVLLADKADITEEMVRLTSHLKQFHSKLKNGDSKGVGKTLEFLIQEMFREINTIGSKCQELEITKTVVDIKTELERMKEQIQNVE